ncbi:DUF2163 domain-containing protein [Meridianimarinicoccus sp. RP-17]|uniref:DUF2163 domain-containing protein n=1 Tax=Meridianimarinicoccus zhengii TaxID=2056810 RepID=UPI000DAEBDB2|nr:DUF2163 domain-containing protein [Phycocomes zhengii]
MKNVSVALAEHLAGPVTTLATCWEIVRRDGVAFAFTDHDRDIAFDGRVYLARFGYARTAVVSDDRLSVDNLDVDGIFDAEAISEQDMRAGLFDHAAVRIFLVNWADTSMGALRLRRGWLGEVMLTEQGTFRTELRGLTQALQQQIGEMYSAECRADLGDARCKVNLAALTRAGSVTGVRDRATFTAALDATGLPADWFDGGVLTWTDGPNAGRGVEVKTWSIGSGQFELYIPPGYPISAGHSFTVVPGCDKRRATCRDRFANLHNFRGEPFVPGLDSLVSYPDAI